MTKCHHCGNQFQPRVSERLRKFCSQKCYRDEQRQYRSAEAAKDRKRCPKCCAVKTLSEFSPAMRSLDNRSGWCKRCKADLERDRRKTPANIERHTASYENDMWFRARQLVRSIEKRCRLNQWAFDLDVDWLAEKLVTGTCELTGLPFNMKIESRTRPAALAPSVDRIVPALGYTKQNCRVILFALNQALSDRGLDAFMVIAEALVANQAAARKVAC